MILATSVVYSYLFFSPTTEQIMIATGIVVSVTEIDLIFAGFLMPLRKVSKRIKKNGESQKVEKVKSIMRSFKTLRYLIYGGVIPALYITAIMFLVFKGKVEMLKEILVIIPSLTSFLMIAMGWGRFINEKLEKIEKERRLN